MLLNSDSLHLKAGDFEKKRLYSDPEKEFSDRGCVNAREKVPL